METEPFGETFGPKAQRKRPRLNVGTFEELSKAGAAAAERNEDLAEGSTGITIITHGLFFSLTKLERIRKKFLLGTSNQCMPIILNQFTQRGRHDAYMESCTK